MMQCQSEPVEDLIKTLRQAQCDNSSVVSSTVSLSRSEISGSGGEYLIKTLRQAQCDNN